MTVRVLKPADKLEWHSARRQFVTASVAGCLLNCHPYQTAYGLWAEKTDRIQRDDEENAAMRRGRLLEPAAAQMLREERPEWVIDYRNDQAFYCDDAIRIGATPDAFAMRPDILGDGIVQFKTSSEEAFRTAWLDEDGDVQIPLWIAVQAIVEAHMTGAKWAAVAVMVVGRGIKMEVVDIPLHEGIWSKLITAVAEFWRVTDSGEHPPIDWDRDGSTIIDVNRMSAAKTIDLCGDDHIDAYAAKYTDASVAHRETEKLKNLCKAQILYAMHDAEIAETKRFQIRAPTLISESGKAYRKISIKLKDQSNGSF
jgi:predicted phage-related endonuclease